MRRTLLAACLLLATAPTALAQNLDALQAAMATLPASVLGNPAPDLVYFVDMQAVLGLPSLEGKPLGPEHLQRTMLESTLRPLEALHMGGPEQWAEKAGVPLNDVQWFAGFGQPPYVAALWGLKDEAAVTALTATLGEKGFAGAGFDVLGNGEPLKLDLAGRDPASPWKSAVGAPTFVTPKGSVLVQASTPELTASIASTTGESAAASPIVATALAGLQQSVGDGWIVEAMLVSPMLGLRAAMPEVLLDQPKPDLDTLRAKLEEQAKAAGQGIPPWFGGFIADVQLETPAVAISLAYPDCTIAKTAAEAIAAKLKDTVLPEAQVTANTSDGVEGLCAATVAVVMPQAGPESLALLAGFLQGNPGALQIGTN